MTMTKRFISTLLALAMVLALVPAFSATAFATGEVTLLVNSATANDDAARGEQAAYKTIAGALSKAQNGDIIKLDSNIAENITISEGKDITLDLNGKVLQPEDNNYRIITVSGGSLTITDSGISTAVHYYKYVASNVLGVDQGKWTWDDTSSSGAIAYESLASQPEADAIIAVKGGAITGGNGGIKIIDDGTLTLNSGNIIANEASNIPTSSLGGGVGLCQGLFIMNGGAIIGNTYHSAGGGVTIFSDALSTRSQFIMNGGTVSYNNGSVGPGDGGGGVYVRGGDFTMTGGTITENTAVGDDIGRGSGGGVYVYEGMNFTMTGGAIYKNYSPENSSGGGIYALGNVTIGGTAKVYSNTLATGVINNIYLPTGKTIAISTDTPLEDNASLVEW